MKKCLNCNHPTKDKDVYCRHCGAVLESNKEYIFINIVTIIVVLMLLCLIALFVASFLMTR